MKNAGTVALCTMGGLGLIVAGPLVQGKMPTYRALFGGFVLYGLCAIGVGVYAPAASGFAILGTLAIAYEQLPPVLALVNKAKGGT